MIPNPVLRRFEAYTPGEQPQGGGYIKLNTNEFPYPAAPEVLEAICRAATDDVRLYPSPRCDELRKKLAQRHGVSKENIFVGNGSDEVLRLLIQAYGGEGRLAAVVDPSYSLYPTLIQAAGSDLATYSLDEFTRLPNELFDSSCDLLLVPIPNPPIGSLIEGDEIERLLQKDALIVLDEAYADFATGLQNVPFVKKCANAVLTRTFSKSFGLAGLRVGYALAHPEVIANLSKLADSYNVNRISQAAAIAALDASNYYMEKVDQIRRDRDWLRQELQKRGFEVPFSHGNFLFARHARAQEFYEKLKSRKILVRYFSSANLSDGLRITIGTRTELDSLLQALTEIL